MIKHRAKAITLFSLLTVLIAFFISPILHSLLRSIIKKLRTTFLPGMLNH